MRCSANQLTSFDVSNNTALTDLRVQYNQLTILDVRNGNNTNIIYFTLVNNPNLTCINVDDSSWASNYWTVVNGSIDTQHYFSNNCSGTAIEEHTTNKELLRTIDVLGRETKETKNEPKEYDNSSRKTALLAKHNSNLERENIELKAKVKELENKLERFGELNETLSEMGFMLR